MQNIAPFLWFDDQAEEAVDLYTSLFKDSKVGRVLRYGEGEHGTKGRVMTVAFQLDGQEFMALNGGPEFKFTPAISFFVSCKTQEEIDKLWEKLSESGSVLMELDQYPFSEKFGWLADKFGVSWQLSLTGSMQKIAPFLMFVGEQHGRAEEAMNFYISQFNNSVVLSIDRYGAGEGEPEGTVSHATFLLNGQVFMAIDSSWEHPFTFTPAISFFVNCETQGEVDLLWENLSEGGEKGQCAWLTDRYGISWQIVPTILGELLQDEDAEKVRRVTNAMLQMGKIDIEKLKLAYEQG